MPALVAYLIAVAFLVGGGLEALSWLTVPEPIQVVAKAKPRPAPRYETAAIDQNRGEDPSKAGITPSNHNDSERATVGSNSLPISPLINSSADVRQNIPPESPDPATDQIKKPASAESPVGAGRPLAGQPITHVARANLASPSRTKATENAGTRQSSPAKSRSEKRPLELMTLRTVEFPDGRRVTRLIPYHRPGHALAFRSDD